LYKITVNSVTADAQNDGSFARRFQVVVILNVYCAAVVMDFTVGLVRSPVIGQMFEWYENRMLTIVQKLMPWQLTPPRHQ